MAYASNRIIGQGILNGLDYAGRWAFNEIVNTTVRRNITGRDVGAPKGGIRDSFANSSKSGVDLQRHLRYSERYGTSDVKILENGKIRYYGDIKYARTPGEMVGQRYVHEFNPTTVRSRGWYECYDLNGYVNRVHPKNLNGNELNLPHYPQILGE